MTLAFRAASCRRGTGGHGGTGCGGAASHPPHAAVVFHHAMTFLSAVTVPDIVAAGRTLLAAAGRSGATAACAIGRCLAAGIVRRGFGTSSPRGAAQKNCNHDCSETKRFHHVAPLSPRHGVSAGCGLHEQMAGARSRLAGTCAGAGIGRAFEPESGVARGQFTAWLHRTAGRVRLSKHGSRLPVVQTQPLSFI